ncbi:unnamed protein product [Anisakis simplex]|uniref:Alternative protein n=1 Tax=Anisakis simplex TaxID=6269 RepID=A0A0M3KJA9_ANISI|nr:unnamed protein product [Anisakis simplex]
MPLERHESMGSPLLPMPTPLSQRVSTLSQDAL